jgi:hypothetical protein
MIKEREQIVEKMDKKIKDLVINPIRRLKEKI